MPAKYLPRALESVVRRAGTEFPAVVLTGPRQAGKTTLLKHLFGTHAGYASLEPPDVRAAASADPRGFLALHPAPVILDEVQYAPDLLAYIKESIDARRHLRGQYFLTGSQNLLLTGQVTESLAGRAAMLRLLPLSERERNHEQHERSTRSLPWETTRSALGQAVDRTPKNSQSTTAELWQGFLRGGYPELISEPGRDISLWYSSYVQTYLERDVRSLRQVGDLTSFQNFVRALAIRTGQLLSLTDVSRDIGVAVNTVKAWLSILEATFQVIVLRPYHSNAGRRLVKMPKVYFADTGLLCYLAGLKDARHAAAGPLGGAIFENAVLLEIVKAYRNRGEEPAIHFWRTSTGVEVDLVVETGGKLIPVEVKLSSTPRPAMANGIRAFQHELGAQAGPGFVIHPGDVRLPLAPNVLALPFEDL